MGLLAAVSDVYYRNEPKKTQNIQEIFGSHYVLPELGPLGANGLANPRDFETPVASFDIDQNPWSG